MVYDVIVCLHGYHKMLGGHETEDVLRDRIRATRRTADTYADLGASVKVLFLGGHGDDDEARTADATHPTEALVGEIEPELLTRYDTEVADHRLGNTRAELVSVTEHIRKQSYDPSIVVSVSSRDHVPRIQRLWTELQKTGVADETYLATAVSSEETYSQSGMLPFILEAARFEPFLVPLNELWSIEPAYYDEAARDISDVLQRYQ